MKLPYDFLPLPAPRDYDPGVGFFYNNIAKPLIEDFIGIMNEGLLIDDKAVDDLRRTVEDVLVLVDKKLAKNKIVKRYQKHKLPEAQKKHAEKSTQSVRTIDYYITDYKHSNILHRTWVINTYLKSVEKEKYIKDKWTVNDLKAFTYGKNEPFLVPLLNKNVQQSNFHICAGMFALAEHKMTLWNKTRYDKAKEKVKLAPFNPASPKQKQELFAMLGIESLKQSDKTGDDSWDRESIENLLEQVDDKDLVDFLQACIDHSFSAIIRNNFLNAFDRFTIDGVLHGNLREFGAKTFRPTSDKPNLLNMPSSKSIYAKPLKRCFIAPEGRVIYSIDLGALEDRGLANLSNDTNKKNIFLEGLDGHSLNACGYFPKKIAKIMGENTDNVAYVKEFYRLVDENEKLDKIRFDSKAPTFKLAYGGYPDASKGGVITQEIFDNYHNVLYPGVTDYRENYVLKTAKKQGYIHLGLGCRMYTSDARGDIRTLHNATIQFWSILTLIAINKFKQRVVQAGYENNITVISTIYDSIYLSVTADPEIIKWVNDMIVPILCVQYLKDQPIPNVAEGFIGYNFADLNKLPNNCELETITQTLKSMND